MHSARRRLTFLSAAIAALAAVLAVVLPLSSASAAAVSAAGTRVGASHPQTILPVGLSRPVSAGEGRCGPAPQPLVAAGACVAAEDGSIIAARTGEGAADGPNLTLDEARAAAESRGVDTSSINLRYQPPDDPFYADKYGFSRFKFDETPYVDANGQYEVTLTNLGLQDEQTAAMTIAHELGHLTEVGPWDEEGAEAFAIRLLGGGG